jgi:hypothetical protein
MLLVAGCGGRTSDPYPRISGGTRAILFDPHNDVVRVVTEPGKGLGASDWQLLDVGTPVLVIGDDAEAADEDRPVRVRVTDGFHRDLKAKARRRHVKPE